MQETLASTATVPVTVWPLVPTRSFDEPLTYLVDEVEHGAPQRGQVVEITIGNTRRFGLIDQVASVERPDGISLKPIIGIEATVTVPPALLDLAVWTARGTGAAITRVLAMVLPPGFASQAKAASGSGGRQVYALRRLSADPDGLTVRQEELLGEIPEFWVQRSTLAEQLGTTPTTLTALVEAGCVEQQQMYLHQLTAGVSEDTMAQMLASGEIHTDIVLSGQQEQALTTITDTNEQAVLLNGITGSGKTEVYLEAIERICGDERGAIILVPEIALTPQTASRFHHRFPGRIAILHSQMTTAERRTMWHAIAGGSADIIIGPRSAIFAPVRDLGLIIIDEEHDSSYKQESEPRYDARRVAFKRAQLDGAKIVMGSGTPRPESWHGVATHVVMDERPGGGRPAPIKVVDLRDHAREYPLSEPLKVAIDKALRRGNKVMLLHNRRGIAGALTCTSCGQTQYCTHCDIALTVHGSTKLSCHYCGREWPLPDTCPECDSTQLTRLGMGTERLERVLAERFDCEVLRLDADTTSNRDDLFGVLNAFREPGPKILIGTQMIAKGHDFPDVELAAVIDADMGRAIPDFRADERTFHLVMQLAGRAGRSAQTGEHGQVIIQTWDPEATYLEFAKRHDIAGFLANELTERQQPGRGYPPYSRLARVLVTGANRATTQQWAASIASAAEAAGFGEVLGPSRLLRIQGDERTQVLIKTHQANRIADWARAYIAGTQKEQQAARVRIHLDIDPQTVA